MYKIKAKIGEIFAKEWGKRLILLFFLILMIIFFSINADKFLSIKNWELLVVNLTPVGIIAVGMTFLLISGEIDLSVGANLGLSSVIVASLYNNGVNTWICIIAVLIVGLFIGIVNGLIVVKIGVNSFIGTIGTMSIISGVAYVITNGLAIPMFSDKIDALTFLGLGTFFNIKFPIVILIIFYLFSGIVLRYTLFGRRVYQTGANEFVSRVFGIKVKKIKYINYMFCGITASFSGLIVSSLTGVGMAQHGSFTFMLGIISSVLLGGIALGGGKGSILGTFIGVFIVRVIYNGMVLLNTPYYYVQITGGAILLIAIMIYGTKTGSIFER